jgi:hypothetical protein
MPLLTDATVNQRQWTRRAYRRRLVRLDYWRLKNPPLGVVYPLIGGGPTPAVSAHERDLHGTGIKHFLGLFVGKRKQFAGLSSDAKLARVNAYFRTSPSLANGQK